MGLTEGGPWAEEVGKQKQKPQGKICHKHFIENTKYMILKQMMCHFVTGVGDIHSCDMDPHSKEVFVYST